jgi:hypothetical protein
MAARELNLAPLESDEPPSEFSSLRKPVLLLVTRDIGKLADHPLTVATFRRKRITRIRRGIELVILLTFKRTVVSVNMHKRRYRCDIVELSSSAM